MPNGVQYRVIEAGNGAKPTQASTVQLEIAGPFPWGDRAEGNQPRPTPAMKVSEVQLPAIRQVLMEMPAGSKWEITLPSETAYGNDPRNGVAPNMAVQFEVKLVDVK